MNPEELLVRAPGARLWHLMSFPCDLGCSPHVEHAWLGIVGDGPVDAWGEDEVLPSLHLAAHA